MCSQQYNFVVVYISLLDQNSFFSQPYELLYNSEVPNYSFLTSGVGLYIDVLDWSLVLLSNILFP